MIALGLAVLIPFIGAVLIVAANNSWCLRNNMLIATSWLNLAVIIAIAYNRTSYTEAQILFETLPGLRIAFHVEPLGLIFALTASALWPITSMYAISYMQASDDRHQTRLVSEQSWRHGVGHRGGEQ